MLEFFAAHAEDTSQMLITALAAQENFWGQDLNQLPSFTAAAAAHLERIRRDNTAGFLPDEEIAALEERLTVLEAELEKERGK